MKADNKIFLFSALTMALGLGGMQAALAEDVFILRPLPVDKVEFPKVPEEDTTLKPYVKPALRHPPPQTQTPSLNAKGEADLQKNKLGPKAGDVKPTNKYADDFTQVKKEAAANRNVETGVGQGTGSGESAGLAIGDANPDIMGVSTTRGRVPDPSKGGGNQPDAGSGEPAENSARSWEYKTIDGKTDRRSVSVQPAEHVDVGKVRAAESESVNGVKLPDPKVGDVKPTNKYADDFTQINTKLDARKAVPVSGSGQNEGDKAGPIGGFGTGVNSGGPSFGGPNGPGPSMIPAPSMPSMGGPGPMTPGGAGPMSPGGPPVTPMGGYRP